AGEGAGIFWPACAPFPDIVTCKIGDNTQKVRGGSRPTATLRHEFADANCYRVRLDNAFDCGFAGRIIGTRKGAPRPHCCSASRGPQGEVCHSRQAREANTGQGPQSMHCGSEQRAQDIGSRDLEFAPKLTLGAPLLLTNWRQGQKNGAVGQICSADDVLDAIYEQRPGSLEKHLVFVGIELTYRETAAAREPTERVGEPRRQV